jgi:hypothetical protein
MLARCCGCSCSVAADTGVAVEVIGKNLTRQRPWSEYAFIEEEEIALSLDRCEFELGKYRD